MSMLTIVLMISSSQPALAADLEPADVAAISASGVSLAFQTAAMMSLANPNNGRAGTIYGLGLANISAPVGSSFALGSALALGRDGAGPSTIPAAIGLAAALSPLAGLAVTGLGGSPSFFIATTVVAPIVAAIATGVQVGLSASYRRRRSSSEVGFASWSIGVSPMPQGATLGLSGRF